MPHELGHEGDEQATKIKLTEAQASSAGIALAEAKGGELRHHFLAPGAIVPDANRVARVAVRLLALVWPELRRKSVIALSVAKSLRYREPRSRGREERIPRCPRDKRVTANTGGTAQDAVG